MTQAIDSLSGGRTLHHFPHLNSISSQDHQQNLSFEADVAKAYRKLVTLPQVLARKTKGMLPIAARNLFLSCYQFFENIPATSGLQAANFLRVRIAGGGKYRFRDGERKRTIAFNMPSNGHYFTALTTGSIQRTYL